MARASGPPGIYRAKFDAMLLGRPLKPGDDNGAVCDK